MALVENTIGRAAKTWTAPAAPTVSEPIANPGPHVVLILTIGATATTVTMNRYGINPAGDAQTDLVFTGLTNIRKAIAVTREFLNPATNAALLELSQVANVTAELVRTGANG